MTDGDVDENEEADEDEELSFEDIGAAYAKAAAQHDPEAFATPEPDPADEDLDDDQADELVDIDEPDEPNPATPLAIIEAAIFVGHTERDGLTSQRLASLMRDVTPEEVDELINDLNASYKEQRQAIRIIQEEGKYRMTIAPEVESIRSSFLGKIREARLSQLAVEVLSLVAYQPGVNSQTVTDQRGRDCGPILNQLVRRRLLEIERIAPEGGGRAVPHYFPTERFLVLFGLESLADLPQVEESSWTAE